jgi:hypothetical protein
MDDRLCRGRSRRHTRRAGHAQRGRRDRSEDRMRCRRCGTQLREQLAPYAGDPAELQVRIHEAAVAAHQRQPDRGALERRDEPDLAVAELDRAPPPLAQQIDMAQRLGGDAAQCAQVDGTHHPQPGGR